MNQLTFTATSNLVFTEKGDMEKLCMLIKEKLDEAMQELATEISPEFLVIEIKNQVEIGAVTNFDETDIEMVFSKWARIYSNADMSSWSDVINAAEDEIKSLFPDNEESVAERICNPTLKCRVRGDLPELGVPVLDEKGAEAFLSGEDANKWLPCEQPDEMDGEEYNLLITMPEGYVIRAHSIDFDFNN